MFGVGSKSGIRQVKPPVFRLERRLEMAAAPLLAMPADTVKSTRAKIVKPVHYLNPDPHAGTDFGKEKRMATIYDIIDNIDGWLRVFDAIINTEKDIAEKWTLFSHKQELLVQLSLRQNKEATPPALAEMFTARINAAYAKAKLTSLKTTAEANRMGETIANDISRIGIVDELAYLHYLGQTEVDAFLRTGLFGGIGKQQPSTSWTEERMRAISDRLAAEGEIYTKKKRRETLILGSAAAATVAVAGGAGVYAAKRYRERTR